MQQRRVGEAVRRDKRGRLVPAAVLRVAVWYKAWRRAGTTPMLRLLVGVVVVRWHELRRIIVHLWRARLLLLLCLLIGSSATSAVVDLVVVVVVVVGLLRLLERVGRRCTNLIRRTHLLLLLLRRLLRAVRLLLLGSGALKVGGVHRLSTLHGGVERGRVLLLQQQLLLQMRRHVVATQLLLLLWLIDRQRRSIAEIGRASCRERV